MLNRIKNMLLGPLNRPQTVSGGCAASAELQPSPWNAGLVIDPTEFSHQLVSLQRAMRQANAHGLREDNQPVASGRLNPGL